MYTPTHAVAAFASESRYELTEEGLAGLAAAGDEAAFEQLLALLEPPMRALICRRLARHVRQCIPVEEVLQTTRIALFTALQRFQPDGEGSLRRYVMRITRNKVVDAARSYEGDRLERRHAERYGEYTARVQHVTDPWQLLAAQEFGELAAEEIESLPDGQRVATRLVLLEGWSYGEAGDDLGLTDDATRLRVKRACQVLRSRLGTLVA